MSDDDYPITKRDLMRGLGAITIGVGGLYAEELREFLFGGNNSVNQNPTTPVDNGADKDLDNQDGNGYDDSSEFGEDVQVFTYDGQSAIAAREVGGVEELLSEYESAGLEEMLKKDHPGGRVFVTEDDRVYADPNQERVYKQIDGVWEDVKDGEVDGQ